MLCHAKDLFQNYKLHLEMEYNEHTLVGMLHDADQ